MLVSLPLGVVEFISVICPGASGKCKSSVEVPGKFRSLEGSNTFRSLEGPGKFRSLEGPYKFISPRVPGKFLVGLLVSSCSKICLTNPIEVDSPLPLFD